MGDSKDPKGVYVDTRPTTDWVNHPPHYHVGSEHEVWKCLNAWGLELDALLWNAVKYIARSGKKGSTLEDLKKAQWYLNKRIELMEQRMKADAQH